MIECRLKYVVSSAPACLVWCRDGTPDSKGHGANMGPISDREDPGGPHVGPMNFANLDNNTERRHILRSKQMVECTALFCP